MLNHHQAPTSPLTPRRWKQRDIHEKREMRKLHIAQLKADIACNEVLRPRLVQIAADVEAQGPPHFSQLVERFKTNPSPEKPPSNAPEQKSYDEMLLSLMLQVWEEAKQKGVEKDSPKLAEALVAGLKAHLVRMDEHQAKMRKDLADEEEEQHKKITMEDLHEGFESHVRTLHRCSACCPLIYALPSTCHPNPRHPQSRAPLAPTSLRRP